MSAHPDRPRFRWLRLSLRTLLVLLTVGCVWLGLIVDRVSDQRHTVKWIKKLGGVVGYDFDFVDDPKLPGPDWLRDLIGIDYFSNVVDVNLSQVQVSDASPLAKLTNLEGLSRQETQVSDLTPLARLTNLKWLDLRTTQVSDVTPLVKLRFFRIT